MPRTAIAVIVEEGRLKLSPSPSSTLAAGALRAQQAAGLETADFIIIAVAPGEADGILADVATAARNAD